MEFTVSTFSHVNMFKMSVVLWQTEYQYNYDIWTHQTDYIQTKLTEMLENYPVSYFNIQYNAIVSRFKEYFYVLIIYFSLF